MKNIFYYSIISILLISFFTACKRTNTPKPSGYLHVDYPEKKYQTLDNQSPFSLRYPVYSAMQPDSDRNAQADWYNLRFYSLNATVHLTYKKIDNNLAKLCEDSYALAYKHAVKADAINEIEINDPKRKVYGLIYEIRGNAASPLQFFLTDSTRNFLRGSLYFHSKPNKDSLAPIITFVRADIDTLIQSLNWKKH
jgi:gliding motility-associated lipoprotein GldD